MPCRGKQLIHLASRTIMSEASKVHHRFHAFANPTHVHLIVLVVGRPSRLIGLALAVVIGS
jgi:hypothetical protein